MAVSILAGLEARNLLDNSVPSLSATIKTNPAKELRYEKSLVVICMLSAGGEAWAPSAPPLDVGSVDRTAHTER
jgi:hypothetical protein